MLDLKSRLSVRIRRLRRWHRIQRILTESSVSAQTQRLLAQQYQYAWRSAGKVPPFAEVGFREFSQNGEDGILLLIFALIGTTSKRAIELCAGDGIECNTANLIINHGWDALLVDGDAANVATAQTFYAAHGNTALWPPTVAQAWLTAENVNDIVASAGFSGPIDLLSLDLDGIDYWIWRALDTVQPRVVVVEFQTAWGPEHAMTVRYDPQFMPTNGQGAGASLAAFVKLGQEKGYRLVGCERLGFNAVFLRNDVGPDAFPAVPAASAFTHPHAQWCVNHSARVLGLYDWVTVD